MLNLTVCARAGVTNMSLFEMAHRQFLPMSKIEKMRAEEEQGDPDPVIHDDPVEQKDAS